MITIMIEQHKFDNDTVGGDDFFETLIELVVVIVINMTIVIVIVIILMIMML